MLLLLTTDTSFRYLLKKREKCVFDTKMKTKRNNNNLSLLKMQICLQNSDPPW